MSAILAALITGVATLLGSVATAITQHYLSKQKLNLAKNEILARVRELGFLLGQTSRAIGADRALLIRVENAGHIRQDGAKFISIVDEHLHDTLPSVLSEFQRFPVDKAYREQVITPLLQSQQRRFLYTAELEEGFLKSLYTATGVQGTWLVHIHDTDAKLWFVAFSFKDTPDVHSPTTKTKLDMLKHRMYSIAAQYPDIIS